MSKPLERCRCGHIRSGAVVERDGIIWHLDCALERAEEDEQRALDEIDMLRNLLSVALERRDKWKAKAKKRREEARVAYQRGYRAGHREGLSDPGALGAGGPS